MKVYTSRQFNNSFKKLPKDIQQTAIKKDLLFRNHPYAKQLKTHKLKGKLSKFWSYSIKYNYKIVFEFIDDETVIYQDIGTHEIYK